MKMFGKEKALPVNETLAANSTLDAIALIVKKSVRWRDTKVITVKKKKLSPLDGGGQLNTATVIGHFRKTGDKSWTPVSAEITFRSFTDGYDPAIEYGAIHSVDVLGLQYGSYYVQWESEALFRVKSRVSSIFEPWMRSDGTEEYRSDDAPHWL